MSSSIPSWQILTAHAQPFRWARDLAFCLKVPLDSLLIWASSEGSGETARMRRLAWTFAARIGYKYQIRSTVQMEFQSYNTIQDFKKVYMRRFFFFLPNTCICCCLDQLVKPTFRSRYAHTRSRNRVKDRLTQSHLVAARWVSSHTHYRIYSINLHHFAKSQQSCLFETWH